MYYMDRGCLNVLYTDTYILNAQIQNEHIVRTCLVLRNSAEYWSGLF